MMKSSRLASQSARTIEEDGRSVVADRSTTVLQRLHHSVGNQAIARAFQRDGEDTIARRIQGALRRGGRLAPTVQQRLEHGLGSSLDQVRVHTDGTADQLARSLHARAFTTGNDIFFRAGRYDPGTPAGLHVLAHEASHTLQQAAGRVDGRPFGDVRVSDPGDRFERAADAAAHRVVQGEAAPRTQGPAGGGRTPVVQRLAESHTHGCACSGCSGLVVQRFPEMDALSLSDWKSESAVGYAKRSTAFRRIDAAVALWDEYRPGRGYLTERIAALEAILVAITAWRAERAGRISSKWSNPSEREAATGELEARVLQMLPMERLRQRRAQEESERLQRLRAAGDIMDPRFAEYAHRIIDEAQYGVVKPGSATDWLTKPRGPGGVLSAEAVAAMTMGAVKESKNLRDSSQRYGMRIAGDVDHAALRRAAENKLNRLTGVSELLELQNLYAPNQELDEVLTEVIPFAGGVSWSVTYNPSDVHFAAKIAVVHAAAAKIVARGFRLPALQLHLPKYGRELNISGDCVTEGARSERAIFHAPDHLHLSSASLGLPILSPASLAKQGEEHLNSGYNYSSAHFDPHGAATVIHEIGHAMHYENSPERFHGLFSTLFSQSMTELATRQVSGYGSKPREFVAEVFLGLVYGREYSEQVMKMYVAFGGALPPDLAHDHGDREDSVAL